MNKNIFKYLFSGILSSACLLGSGIPQIAIADPANVPNVPPAVQITNGPRVSKTLKMVVTAYSSTPDQTDDTPFVTASGKYVEDGVVANNMLPFGTKIRIPELYGDKVFVIEDRMHKRKGDYHIDIWMPDKSSAINFGIRVANIEILED